MNIFIKSIALLLFMPAFTIADPIAFLMPKMRTPTNGVLKIMIIDTGIDGNNRLLKPYMNHKDRESDYIGHGVHGTHIAGLVIFGPLKVSKQRPLRAQIYGTKICPQVQIYSCNFMVGNNTIKETIRCLKRAYDEGMDAINYSAGGEAFVQEEYDAIKKLQDVGVIMTVAAGNDGLDLSKPGNTYYPASYAFLPTGKALKNIIPVGNLEHSHNVWERADTSNYGHKIPMEIGTDVWSTIPETAFSYIDHMTGTSQASAIFMHKLILDKCDEISVKLTK